MVQPSAIKEQINNIEKMSDLMVRSLSILVGCDDLKDDISLDCIVRFRQEHIELVKLRQAIDSSIKWGIRCAFSVICVAATWILVNVTTIITLVEAARR